MFDPFGAPLHPAEPTTMRISQRTARFGPPGAASASCLLPMLLSLLLLPAGAPELSAQATDPLEAGLQVERLEASRESLVLAVGERARLSVRALDASGAEVDAVVRITGPRQGVRILEDGVEALAVGEWTVVATVGLPAGAEAEPASLRIPVVVEWPAVTALRVLEPRVRLYRGSTVRHQVEATHADGSPRPRPPVSWESSDPEVATVDAYGIVTAHAAGSVRIGARIDGVESWLEHEVEPLPVDRMEIGLPEGPHRTGDVVPLELRAWDEQGAGVDDLPASWGYGWDAGAHDIVMPGAEAQIRDGRFVAEVPGDYTVFATVGERTARVTFSVEPREVVHGVQLLGQGRVNEYHTSDFWIWEGVDGRDWALTGTWGADGWSYLWDVTDPAAMVKTDSLRIDARTVNDVKVSPDGRYGVLTREGASDRVNGLVVLDLASEPGRIHVATEMSEGLTGGVHNTYPTDDYLYALSGGQKYLIIDMSDIENPRTVGEVQHEDCRIHDVWVHDGIAYSAQWGCGLLVHDVGNGAWGGSPEAPVFVSQFLTPGGRTHAVFPYYQEETGIFYVYLGDEIIGRSGMAWAGQPSGPYSPATPDEPVPEQTAGYIHIVDFSDPAEPRKVARYHVPEYGTHNIWVEDDVLYQAYYEGGLRVVDVSGELQGNLADQGREMAVFKPHDPFGHIRNAAQVWSAMPFKGRVFLSDHNSGLWAVEIEPPEAFRPVS